MKQNTPRKVSKQPALRDPVSAVRATASRLAETKQRERLDRIQGLALDLIDVAQRLPGGVQRTLPAVCAAALCDAIARSRP